MGLTAISTIENDSVLIERTGRGDRDAFEELYRRFARPVLAMARRQLGDSGRAEEATQETFAAIWRSARSYRAERGTASAHGELGSRRSDWASTPGTRPFPFTCSAM